MFVWRDFREDGKLRRKKWRESIFSECLVGREEEKNSSDVFFLSPSKCFLLKLGRKLERKTEAVFWTHLPLPNITF